ncbi:MAG: hypothetical protein WBD31_18685 [Rubripirellula sp.]
MQFEFAEGILGTINREQGAGHGVVEQSISSGRFLAGVIDFTLISFALLPLSAFSMFANGQPPLAGDPFPNASTVLLSTFAIILRWLSNPSARGSVRLRRIQRTLLKRVMPRPLGRTMFLKPIGKTDSGELLLGYDARLLRRVWIHRVDSQCGFTE